MVYSPCGAATLLEGSTQLTRPLPTTPTFLPRGAGVQKRPNINKIRHIQPIAFPTAFHDRPRGEIGWRSLQ